MKFLIFLSLKLLFKEFERHFFSCFIKSAYYSTLSPLLLKIIFMEGNSMVGQWTVQ